MSYSIKDFSGCVFNALTEGDMLSVYPKLSSIIEDDWKHEPLLDNIIRFVVLVYDPKSALRKERDSMRRKNIAYDLAGFKRNELGEAMPEIIHETHELCLYITVRFLAKFVKDKEYAALCAFEFKYYENILELMTPIKGETNAERLEAAKKKSVISEEIIKDIKVIDDLWHGFFGDKTLVEKVKTKKFIPEMM
jgi:hypothetical protein